MRALRPALAGAPGGAPTPLGDLALRVPWLMRRMAALHATVLLRVRRGPMRRWFGAPVLVLETVGRRSGRTRETPLVYLPDGDGLVVVPANAGAAADPAWWLNLQAAGTGAAIVGGRRDPVRPRVASGAERDRLWARVAAVAPLDHYQRRSQRRLPVVVLERLARV